MGENCAPSAVDVICPLVVVVRSGFPACNSRELLWHLLPGPVIGGQVCRVPPINTAEWEEKKELSARTNLAKRRIECEGKARQRICRETILVVFRGGHVRPSRLKLMSHEPLQ